MRLAALVCVAACGCAQTVDAPPPPSEPESAPLKVWMTANLSRAVKTEDFEALGRALSALAQGGPPEFAGWAGIAERGAQAAAERDIERVRASCAECHKAYRADYRERFRARPFAPHAPAPGGRR
jgi:hypothetical protein